MNRCPNCGGVNEDVPPDEKRDWWCWDCLKEKTREARGLYG